jgi:hypothetical protein
VIVGERPGGGFSAYLMLEEQGVTYEKGPDGKRKIPPFQMMKTPLTAEYPQSLIWEIQQ